MLVSEDHSAFRDDILSRSKALGIIACSNEDDVSAQILALHLLQCRELLGRESLLTLRRHACLQLEGVETLLTLPVNVYH